MEFAFFGALTLVGALFVFNRKNKFKEKKMKKLLLLLATVLIMTLCLASCTFFRKGTNNTNEQNTNNSTENPDSDNKQDSTPACSHTTVIDEAVAATCTENGLTAGAHCSTCNAVLAKQEVIPAAHKYGEWENVKVADCFFDGEDKRICSVCEYVDTKVIPHLEHNFAQNENTKLFACETCDARILNGHLYATFDVALNWCDAYEWCDGIDGHLVTITSETEQKLITELVSVNTVSFYWIGGFRNSNGWQWITNEPFIYTHWAATQPNNSESDLFMNVSSAEDDTNWTGYWNDINVIGGKSANKGFICEWELDINENVHYFTEWETITEATCFADGEQYRICTHCGLEENEVIAHIEHNFILNEETEMSTCEHCGAGLYDSRIYKIIEVKLSWFDAYTYCKEIGGHLVTITSAEEQTFVESYMNSQSFTTKAWIGAYSDGARWQWVTDESFEYTNWCSGEPNCSSGREYFCEINYERSGLWNDLSPFEPRVFICEWEAE